MRSELKKFVEREVVPHVPALEAGDMPPYGVLRKLYATFGLDKLAAVRFQTRVERAASPEVARSHAECIDEVVADLLPTLELSRHCPGLVAALSASTGLAPAVLLRRGTPEQRARWALPLLTLERIGAFAVTEPSSGSDAFGSMQTRATPFKNGFKLHGQKTFITNGPFADTLLVVAKLAGDEPRIVTFVLDRGMPGLTQSGPQRKMGLHACPTGDVFLDEVFVEPERLIGMTDGGSGRRAIKSTFNAERLGIAAMGFGIVERCLELCVEHARTRTQFGQPIGEFQLIQLKLARMVVARTNIQNLLFRQIEMIAARSEISPIEASACKLYVAQATVETCLEAIQVFGGHGYMADLPLEQLARDAKALQIYGGTDEIQVVQIARALVTRT
jgi:alkylation response protein AidB-like acyl-CoA dehydrogenase